MAFREHVDKTPRREVVLYRLGEREYLPWETHADTTQTLRVLSGAVVVDTGPDTHVVRGNESFTVPRGTHHRVSAVGPSILMSTYRPPIVFDEDHAETYALLDLDAPREVSREVS